MAECYRCGQEGHRRAECPRDEGLPAAPPQQATARYPVYLEAAAYRRPASEVSPPTEEYRRVCEQIRGGNMPPWLRKRMDAWHQVVESRRDPFNVRNGPIPAAGRVPSTPV